MFKKRIKCGYCYHFLSNLRIKLKKNCWSLLLTIKFSITFNLHFLLNSIFLSLRYRNVLTVKINWEMWSLVNVNIRIIVSLLAWPKVIIISGFYCNLNQHQHGLSFVISRCNKIDVYACEMSFSSTPFSLTFMFSPHSTRVTSISSDHNWKERKIFQFYVTISSKPIFHNM